ncbi:ANTAR domain-containing protein [Kitasatospora sp. NPDC085464]|uniref:ANTAR domain-containing protein n=1 Tax=Kitasatospora sp. NPDC085464 TaxID=3364063 RepID=UPI0037C9D279
MDHLSQHPLPPPTARPRTEDRPSDESPEGLPPDRTQAILEAAKRIGSLLKARGHPFALAGGVAAYAHGAGVRLQHGCTAFSAYLGTVGEPGASVLGLVKVLALQASAALDRSALARAVADLLDRRHSTGLAIGITMERFGVTPHAALALLVRAAQRSGTDLETVARRPAVGEEAVPSTSARAAGPAAPGP